MYSGSVFRIPPNVHAVHRGIDTSGRSPQTEVGT